MSKSYGIEYRHLPEFNNQKQRGPDEKNTAAVGNSGPHLKSDQELGMAPDCKSLRSSSSMSASRSRIQSGKGSEKAPPSSGASAGMR